MNSVRTGASIAGMGLLLTGGWLVARAVGLPLVGLDRLWPAALILTGLTLWVQHLLGEGGRGGLAFTGTLMLLAGSFVCLFTFQVGRLTWTDLTRYWPVFPLIGSAAFIMLYLVEDMSNADLLKPAYLLGGLGLLLLPFTLGVLGGPAFSQMARLWPLLLIPFALLGFLWLRSRGHSGRPGSG